ncbi:MAG: hypothetical protein NTW50_03415 [Candidatus Berkelbacteria bacterium]|nr:hypothetical protein [Candidatus Berkelbacteria bacterium]
MKIKKYLPHIGISIIVLTAMAFTSIKFLIPSIKSTINSPQSASAAVSPDKSSSQNTAHKGQFGQGRGNFQPLHGTIASINGQTIVMTTDDKSTKNINCSTTTRISRQDNGQMTQLSISDLKVSDEINVMSSDTTATDITPRMIIIGTFTAPTGGSGGNGTWQRPNSNSGSSDSFAPPSDGSASGSI